MTSAIVNITKPFYKPQVSYCEQNIIRTSRFTLLADLISHLKVLIGGRGGVNIVFFLVCHHFEISHIGPLYHPRITPNPTFDILLAGDDVSCHLAMTHKDKFKDKYTDKDQY